MSSPTRPEYYEPFRPRYPCRFMETRHCPAIYGDVCGDLPCARYENDDETPWLGELMPITREDLLAERKLRYRLEQELGHLRLEIQILRANQHDDLDAYLAEQMKNPKFAAAYERARIVAAMRERAHALRREGLTNEAEANETAAELIERREI